MLDLITDRTQADVSLALSYNRRGYENLTAEEKAQYDAGMKGAYNASDLNRVGAAANYVYNLFLTWGYQAAGYTTMREDWARSDIPTPAEMAAYLDNIKALRDVLSTLPLPETMESLDYIGANEIEQMLLWSEEIISHISWIYTAQFNAYSWESNLYFGKAIRTWAELDALNTTWANWQVATWIDLLIGDLEETGVVE